MNSSNSSNYTNIGVNGLIFWGSSCDIGSVMVDIKHEDNFGLIMSLTECVQAILSITANLLTILAVVKNPKLRTITYTYVLNLAISDMVSGVLMFYEFLFRIPALNVKLHESFLLCMSLFYFISATIYESMLLIALMSFERFMYICYPFKYEMLFSIKTVKLSISTSWILSFVFPLIPIISSSFNEFVGCVYGVLSGYYYYYGLGLSFYMAMVLCFCFHVNILRVAANHRKRIACLTTSKNKSKPHKSPIAHHWRMIKTFLLVYSVSYICWFPWVTCVILMGFHCVSRKLLDIFSLFGMASGTLNFLVYGLLNDDFRKTFKKLICGNCKPRNFDERICTSENPIDLLNKNTFSKDATDESVWAKKATSV